MMNKSSLALSLLIASTLAPFCATFAHHSTAPNFDDDKMVELDGTIEQVNWRNPHITLTLKVVDAGKPVVWDIETNSVNSVMRIGLTRDLMQAGTKVRVAGNPGKNNRKSLWLTNMLLPDGREVLTGKEEKPRWTSNTVGADIQGEISKSKPELGIFRIWTSVGRGNALWKGQTDFPLTSSAAAVRAKFDPVRDSPVLGCKPKGMPLIMEQPYPMEFINKGEEIVFRLEEYDTVRHIAMSDAQKKKVLAQKPSLLGNSVGHWEGKSLVIETSGITYKFFDKTGIMLSPAVKTVEKFTPTADGSQLDYEMTITDPATFTKPVQLGKSWVYRPNNKIQSYNCEDKRI